MTKITHSQLKEIIEKVNYPCNNPEGLLNSLNSSIELYEEVKDKPYQDRRTKIKKHKNSQKAFLEFKENSTQDLLGSFSLIEHYTNKLLHAGIEQREINSSIFILRKMIKLIGQEMDHGVEMSQNQINSIPNKTHPTHNHVFLYFMLPKLYERYFDRKFGISNPSDGKKSSGPSLRFIQAISEYMNIETTPHSIAKGWQRAKKWDT